MTRLRHRVAVVPAVSVVLALGAAPAAASSSIPFSATVSGSGAVTGPDTVAFSGSGRAILMGAVTNDGTFQIIGPDSSCPGGIANINTEVITAASGDTLAITSQDVACPTGPGTVEGTGHWRVSAGSGRFHGATGGGTATGAGDYNTGMFTNTFSGTLSLAQG